MMERGRKKEMERKKKGSKIVNKVRQGQQKKESWVGGQN